MCEMQQNQFGGKSIALNAYFRKEEKYKTNNLCFHFRKLEKEKQYRIKEEDKRK